MAKRTVFPVLTGIDMVVIDVVVLYPEAAEVLLVEGFFLHSCVLWVFLSTPRSRSCCTLMCRAANAKEASSCSCALQTLKFLVSIRFL